MGRSHGRYESNGRTLGSTTRWPLAVESSLRSPAERYLRISSYHSPTLPVPHEERNVVAGARSPGFIRNRNRNLHHAFFGPGTTAEPFCRLEKLGDRPIFTCLQT